ncbi:integrin beta-1-like [Amphiura filiformis]|uniref:integrin beta-1-like n=1 Tax=Amphiura filiformis TaxID=82378 RepID=UPI003B21E664
MDLSYSMLQHLTNVAQLGDDLRILENSLGGDLHLGFGSFVDKPVLPFITSQDTCERDACCPGPLGCELPYSFKNHLPLTNETGKFSSLVAGANVSTGLDAPEGGLDALNQVAVCAEQIGWRNRSRRIVVFITDAIFHFAGDGKLAGISKPNDGECHLDPVTNEYTKSTDQDYPSVGHISAQLHNKNIIPLFVVDGRMYELYQNLSQLFKGGRVGRLSVDSANVIDLLTHILYNQIASNVNIVDTAPDNIAIYYTSVCADQNEDSTPSRCKETGVAEFDVEMLATDCSPNGEKQTFTMRPFGIDESLTVTADVICSCTCESNGVRDPSYCTNGNGTLTCGQCECDEGRYGSQCECDGDSRTDPEDLSNCIRPALNNPVVCQGRGYCMCGECVCDKPMRPGDAQIYGRYCECDNMCDDVFQGLPCGGKERGECFCDSRTLIKQCRCKPGYYGSACECISSTKYCETRNGLICNGWGSCTCEGKCRCKDDSPFTGEKCEDCAMCIGRCSSFQGCVLCKVFDKGPLTKDQCDMCMAPINCVDNLVQLNGTDITRCEYRDEDDCTILYTYVLQEDGSYTVLVQRTKGE